MVSVIMPIRSFSSSESLIMSPEIPEVQTTQASSSRSKYRSLSSYSPTNIKQDELNSDLQFEVLKAKSEDALKANEAVEDGEIVSSDSEEVLKPESGSVSEVPEKDPNVTKRSRSKNSPRVPRESFDSDVSEIFFEKSPEKSKAYVKKRKLEVDDCDSHVGNIFDSTRLGYVALSDSSSDFEDLRTRIERKKKQRSQSGIVKDQLRPRFSFPKGKLKEKSEMLSEFSIVDDERHEPKRSELLRSYYEIKAKLLAELSSPEESEDLMDKKVKKKLKRMRKKLRERRKQNEKSPSFPDDTKEQDEVKERRKQSEESSTPFQMSPFKSRVTSGEITFDLRSSLTSKKAPVNEQSDGIQRFKEKETIPRKIGLKDFESPIRSDSFVTNDWANLDELMKEFVDQQYEKLQQSFGTNCTDDLSNNKQTTKSNVRSLTRIAELPAANRCQREPSSQNCQQEDNLTKLRVARSMSNVLKSLRSKEESESERPESNSDTQETSWDVDNELDAFLESARKYSGKTPDVITERSPDLVDDHPSSASSCFSDIFITDKDLEEVDQVSVLDNFAEQDFGKPPETRRKTNMDIRNFYPHVPVTLDMPDYISPSKSNRQESLLNDPHDRHRFEFMRNRCRVQRHAEQDESFSDIELERDVETGINGCVDYPVTIPQVIANTKLAKACSKPVEYVDLDSTNSCYETAGFFSKTLADPAASSSTENIKIPDSIKSMFSMNVTLKTNDSSSVDILSNLSSKFANPQESSEDEEDLQKDVGTYEPLSKNARIKKFADEQISLSGLPDPRLLASSRKLNASLFKRSFKVPKFWNSDVVIERVRKPLSSIKPIRLLDRDVDIESSDTIGTHAKDNRRKQVRWKTPRSESRVHRKKSTPPGNAKDVKNLGTKGIPLDASDDEIDSKLEDPRLLVRPSFKRVQVNLKCVTFQIDEELRLDQFDIPHCSNEIGNVPGSGSHFGLLNQRDRNLLLKEVNTTQELIRAETIPPVVDTPVDPRLRSSRMKPLIPVTPANPVSNPTSQSVDFPDPFLKLNPFVMPNGDVDMRRLSQTLSLNPDPESDSESLYPRETHTPIRKLSNVNPQEFVDPNRAKPTSVGSSLPDTGVPKINKPRPYPSVYPNPSVFKKRNPLAPDSDLTEQYVPQPQSLNQPAIEPGSSELSNPQVVGHVHPPNMQFEVPSSQSKRLKKNPLMPEFD